MRNHMRAAPECSRCGTSLNNDAPDGFCPACMLEGALRLGEDRIVPRGESEPTHHLPRLGDYQLLEEIARGGMGVVYKARQINLNRIVAVKLILVGQFADKAAVRRFKAEASAAAKLCHPNIVAIHEIGEEAGQHFFSMDYVEGLNLADFARQQPVSIRQAAELVRTIAEAVDYAHEHGIIHRDLKPSNILIDCFHAPHITDFGLARDLRADSELTVTGQVLGSPNYISPEQASGNALVGVATDIYSLGAILYHLLTGRPPFAAETLTATLGQVTRADPISPRALNPSVPRDLETICLKCLEKEPAQRYSSAGALAEELSCFLNGEPIVARPITAPARAWRWCKRHPAVAGLTSVVLSLGAALAVGSLWAALRLEFAQQNILREKDRAERTVLELKLHNAERAIEEGDSSSGIAILAQILRAKPDSTVASSWIVDVLGRLPYPLPATPPLQHEKATLKQARFSPDGRIVATATSGIGFWDAANGQPMSPFLSLPSAIESIAFSPDGTRLAVAGADGTARIVEVPTGKLLSKVNHPGAVFSVSFSPDGTRLVTSTRARFARVSSALTSAQLIDDLYHADEVNYAEFSPDGTQILTASEDGTAMIWDAATGQPLVGPLNHKAEVWMAKFARDGLRVATVSRDRSARIWDARTGLPMTPSLRHQDFVEYLEFSPDGRILATCSYDKTVRLWDAFTGAQRVVPLRHNEKVNSAKFSPDGKKLVTAAADGLVHVWDVDTGQPLARPITHTRKVWYAEFSPDGARIVTAGGDHKAGIWSIEQPPHPVTVVEVGAVAADVEFAKDGSVFATGCYDRKAEIWDARTFERRTTPMQHPDGVTDVELSLNGKWLYTRCGDGIGRIWNAVTGQLRAELKSVKGGKVSFGRFSSDSTRLVFQDQLLRLWDVQNNREIGNGFALELNQGWINRAQLSPDGRFVAIAISDGTVHLFDTDTMQPAGATFSAIGTVTDLDFSPDGRYLLAAGMDRQARILDLHTRALRVPPMRHNMEVMEACFDSTGNRVATASADATARVWDANTGQPLTPPLKHAGKLTGVSFSPDGRLLLTCSIDGTARIWDSVTGEPLSAPLVHGAGVTAARFSPDGSLVVTASRDATVRIWQRLTLPAEVPGWLADFAEVMVRKRVNESGGFEFVPPDAFEKVKERINAHSAVDPWAIWAKRFLYGSRNESN
jgi:eukaryotic-like serine/threonine-protein kinase